MAANEDNKPLKEPQSLSDYLKDARMQRRVLREIVATTKHEREEDHVGHAEDAKDADAVHDVSAPPSSKQK